MQAYFYMHIVQESRQEDVIGLIKIACLRKIWKKGQESQHLPLCFFIITVLFFFLCSEWMRIQKKNSFFSSLFSVESGGGMAGEGLLLKKRIRKVRWTLKRGSDFY